MRLIDAEELERDGWHLYRTVQVDRNTMEYQTKKPTAFTTLEMVRCKDCKHYYFAENRVPEEQSWVCDVWHVNQTAHMGYCFKAERRSNE